MTEFKFILISKINQGVYHTGWWYNPESVTGLFNYNMTRSVFHSDIIVVLF